jgi:hypothetical protein
MLDHFSPRPDSVGCKERPFIRSIAVEPKAFEFALSFKLFEIRYHLVSPAQLKPHV